MMEEYKQIIGVTIVSLTFLSIVISVTGIIFRVNGLINSSTRLECNFQMKLLMACMMLLSINGILLYVIDKTWIQNPEYIFMGTIWWRLVISVLMLILSVIVTILGIKSNPFRE